jgi:hypothetical protein
VKHYLTIGLIAIVGVLTTITGYDQLHKLSVVAPATFSIPFSTQQGIHVSAQAWSAGESKQFLGHDLLSRGIQPLHVIIENRSAREYSLCTSSVDLPCIKPSEAAFKVSKSAIPRAIAYRIASFLFWPIGIPSTIDGIRTYSHHRTLKADYRAKSFKEKGEIVAPYSTYHRVLFVPLDQMQSSFAVTLIDAETMEPKVHQTRIS